MNTGDSYRTTFLALLAVLGFACTTGAGAAGLAEPPRVIYGKVVKLGQGGSFQLFTGTMHLTLVNSQNSAQVLDLDIPLRKVGANGEFSYRAEINQETAPASDRLSNTLTVGTGPITYNIQSVTIGGFAASLLDPSQPAQISTSFADRGTEIRLDFKTDFPTPDTDGDGIPDWWERLYGLNPNNKNDALLDPDGDGWNNLKEFLMGTDPLKANTSPILQDSLLVVNAGGSAGVYLSIADADTPASNLRLTLLNGGTGLTWKRMGTVLQTGGTFTYADILAGIVSVDVSMSFQKDTVTLRLEDLTTKPDVAAQDLSVAVEAFSPALRLAGTPAVWLDAGNLGAVAALDAWPDTTAAERDGYQPNAASQPGSDGAGRVNFAGNRFLYLDDRNLNLGQNFTAFFSFNPGAATASEQALFSSSALRVSLAPVAGQSGSMGLRVLQGGREVQGPSQSTGGASQFTLMSGNGASVLDCADRRRVFSSSSAKSPVASFFTLGGARALSAPTADSFFSGSLREVLFFERALTADERALVQDYQRSRWEGIRVWNYRTATLPLHLQGEQSVRNTMTGGEEDDEITGGDQDDILRGGPGNNRLTGGAGADRFCFVSGSNADVIADFSEDEGDIIDLSEIFAGKTGPISQYITVKSVVVRDAGNLPRVDSILQLNHAGTGSAVDQTITLEGVSLGDSDLPRLAGLGMLQSGIGRPASAGEPQLTLPGTLLVREAQSAQGAVVTINVSASDPVDGVLTPVLSPPSGSVFPLGDTTVSVSAMNSAGTVKTGSLTVRVTDTTAPAIAGSFGPLTTYATGGQAPVPDYLSQAVITDAVGVTGSTQQPAPGTIVGVGALSVTITAADAAGNNASRNIDVLVRPSGSTNADLSALAVSGGTINPVFASGTIGYTMSVPNNTLSLAVTPTTAHPQATVQVRVNGGSYAAVNSGSASAALPLSVDSNTVEVLVTAQDGVTTKTYTVVVNRLRSYLWANFAGTPQAVGSADGTGAAAGFAYPGGAATDSAGNIYVADTSNHTIRKITPAGVVSTLAGLAGTPGSSDGSKSAARFNNPGGLAVAANGDVYVADTSNHTIRKITAAGMVTTFAGNAGSSGSADGPGNGARFFYPSAVAVDGSGNVFVADTNNHTLRKITPTRAVSTLAGTAASIGSADGSGAAARFNYPTGIAVGAGGVLVVADQFNHTVRKVTSTGVVTTLAGTAGASGSTDGVASAARFYYPAGVAIDGSGRIYVADSLNYTIRRIESDATVLTIGGEANVAGTSDGADTAAHFDGPVALAVDTAGRVYVADQNNSRISRGTPVSVDLSNLAISGGTLSPTFASAITGYVVNVADTVTSVTLTPTAAQADTTTRVRINGGTYATVPSGAPSAPLSLNMAVNTAEVLVSAPDGISRKTYTVTVTRATIPTVTSPTATYAMGLGASLGGTVATDGGSPVTERGVIYALASDNSDPVIGGTGVTKVAGTGTIGVFTVSVPGLPQGVTYCYKAYATNSRGTGYTAATFVTLTDQEAWRLQYFGTKQNGGEAADDAISDASGHNNRFKYIAGLVPRDKNSKFTVDQSPVAGQASHRTISFGPTFPDRQYTVQYSTDLKTWSVLNGPSQGNGANMIYTDTSSGGTLRFYRVMIAKP